MVIRWLNSVTYAHMAFPYIKSAKLYSEVGYLPGMVQ